MRSYSEELKPTAPERDKSHRFHIEELKELN